MNDIQTWQQGQFIDMKQYSSMSKAWKEERINDESKLVRPSPTGNSICRCSTPENAAWIASRLNFASTVEHMVYDYATGKTDGSELVAMIQKAING